MRFNVAGPGSVSGNEFALPAVATAQTTTVIAAMENAFATATLRLVPAPAPSQPVIAVATYYGGIALHDARTFKLLGLVATGGAPGDVAFGPGGSIVAPLTGGDTLVTIGRSPWSVSATANVPFGNEVVTARDGSIYVSNRDVQGKGAVTRVSAGGTQRIETGVTAEGLALDEAAHRLYVGNVNDDSIAVVDTRTFTLTRRIHAVPRVFGIALDAAHARLFAVSNQNGQMRKGGGYVAAIDTRTGRQIARSADFPFPLAAAFDASTKRLFVTDEDTGNVYVLDAGTLKMRHAPVRACDVPWRPHFDTARHLLYVPCTRASTLVVIDTRSMRQVPGSPFPTGRYPLGVATP